MVKVGILGAGFMGTTHARAFSKMPHVQIAVIVDTIKEKAERLAGEIGCRFEMDQEIIFNDAAISLVDVTLPTPFHTQYAMRSMQSGKHVIVEKPLALSIADADAIIDVSHKTGKFLMVAQVLRFWPEYAAIRDILQSGRLGKPISAVTYRLSNAPQWATWFLDPKASGGTVLDLAIHDIDMLNWLFGPPENVFASGADERNDDWGHVMILGNHAGVKTSIEASFNMPKDFPFAAGIRVLCDKGMLEYKFQASGASLEQGEPLNIFRLYEPGNPNQLLKVANGDAYENEIAYFVKCVENEQAPQVVTGEDARTAIKVALCARQSMLSGKPVRVFGKAL